MQARQVGQGGRNVRWSQLSLKDRPFRLTADVTSYVSTPPAEDAKAILSRALQRREGFCLIDGQTGVGKTFSVLSWLDNLDTAFPRVWLPYTHSQRPADLLQAILFDLDQPYQGLNDNELRLAVVAQLIKSLQCGRPIILVIDEAQHLTVESLEELRLLSNIDGPHGKALLGVLIGSPALRQALMPHGPFIQRIVVHQTIRPMTAAESLDYLSCQIRRAGVEPDQYITPEALELISEHGQGLPRRINLIASVCCDIASEVGSPQIDAEIVLASLERLPEGSPLSHAGKDVAARERIEPPSRGRKAKSTRKRAA